MINHQGYMHNMAVSKPAFRNKYIVRRITDHLHSPNDHLD